MSDSGLQAVIDELAVRRVLDEYCLRLECDAFEAWLDLFTEDTVYEVFRMKLAGRTELAQVLSQAPHGVHVGGAARIEITGDSATAIQNYAFVSTSSDEWNVGWYWRLLVRSEAGWKIAHTKVKMGRKGDLPLDERAHKVAYPINLE